MIVVRNVFRCKPGKAAELASRMQKMVPLMKQNGSGNVRVMVDLVADFWTVVLDMEAPDLGAYEKMLDQRNSTPEMRDAMGNYMDLVEEGRREVYKLMG
jgi:hypothetical protein